MRNRLRSVAPELPTGDGPTPRHLVDYETNAFVFFDPDHLEDEDRFILLGQSFKPRLLVVCHCFRENDSVIRLVSAKKADKGEEQESWRQR